MDQRPLLLVAHIDFFVLFSTVEKTRNIRSKLSVPTDNHKLPHVSTPVIEPEPQW